MTHNLLIIFYLFLSSIIQRLGPLCLSFLGPFFLAESLEWDINSLKMNPNTTTSSDDLGTIPELTLDRLTGVLGGGGVSVQYINSMGLLLHSYQSGHSIASGIKLFNTTDNSTEQTLQQNRKELCITHSFLLAVGPRRGDGNVPTTGVGYVTPSAKFTKLVHLLFLSSCCRRIYLLL